MNQIKVPLSYNPIDAIGLAQKLADYSGRPHQDLIIDFEEGLKINTGAGNVLAVNTGTAAIHLGLKVLGVGEGDRVIVSTFTYIASVTPILYLNAIPILVDCEPTTWNLDPVLLEEAVNACVKAGNKPKAIIVVHTYGMPAKMKEIMAIADHYQIPVLEDAAEAIGSKYEGNPLGTLGAVGTLSFNNNKILTTFGGGAVLTNNASSREQMLYWATHSRKNLPYYEHDEVGFNYRMGALNAAMGLVELESLTKNITARRNNFKLYQQLLGNNASGWQTELSGSISNRWFACVMVESSKLGKIRDSLMLNNVETRPFWKPMHQQPLFKNIIFFLNGTADQLFETGICLPSSNKLSVQTIEMIARTFNEA